MSVAVSVNELTESEITLCETDLVIREENCKKKKKRESFFFQTKTIDAFRKEGDRLLVPFHWGSMNFNNKRPKREDREEIHAEFVGQLRDDQKKIQKECITIMNKRGSCLLAIYPGGGKTITSLSIASRIRMKTFILVNKLVLIKQWQETIEKVFQKKARMQVIYSKTKINPACDFYIMNAINVPKRAFEEYGALKIGLVIVDECHLMMTKIFSQSLTFFCPRYLIGLSATPFRPDGYDVFLDLYFGKEKVIRNLYRPHKVLLYETGIPIKHETDERGEMIWQSVIDNQTRDEKRNGGIVSICKKFNGRSILILSKRIAQIQALHDMLKDTDERVTMIRDGDGAFDKEARILIATFQKVGTGFSHDKLDMLILATDAESYFLQYLGRVFRTQEVSPIIVDIVDHHPVLKKHFKSRRVIYQQAGGKIEKYHPDFLDLGLAAAPTPPLHGST